jgi:hypothetical protein
MAGGQEKGFKGNDYMNFSDQPSTPSSPNRISMRVDSLVTHIFFTETIPYSADAAMIYDTGWKRRYRVVKSNTPYCLEDSLNINL